MNHITISLGSVLSDKYINNALPASVFWKNTYNMDAFKRRVKKRKPI